MSRLCILVEHFRSIGVREQSIGALEIRALEIGIE